MPTPSTATTARATSKRYLEALRWIERDPAMVAVGAHLLVIGHR